MSNSLKPILLAGAALCAASSPIPAQAADARYDGESPQNQDSVTGDIVVSATRRDTTVQSAPINIAAVSSERISERGLTNLRSLTQLVPGIYTPDNGPRAASLLIVRGLNADPLGLTEYGNAAGGTVATYVGEVPFYIDLRPIDLQRVEFLAGPQGTLYGAGTLAGAIRYIPNRPQFDKLSGEVRADFYGYTHGNAPSASIGATINIPITENLAFRGSFERADDTGFIDQPFVVRQPGVSKADPDWTNPAAVDANLHSVRGTNAYRMNSGRAALRWAPGDALEANLSYYYQYTHADGRQASSHGLTDFPIEIGKYENAKRVLEPNRRTNHMLALELLADLDFADLTSSTARSWYRDDGGRDQTDLLINLDFGYEVFPEFTAYTNEIGKEDRFVQELRLVSKNEGPFSWIIGGYYSHARSSQSSAEYTPGYSQYLYGLGQAAQIRPDDLEYYYLLKSRLSESAAYGEVSYKITPSWQVTAGARYYQYSLKTQQASDLPLYNTISGAAGPDDVTLAFVPGGQKDHGFLFKANMSYTFSPTALGYATFSQGYRIGNSNGVTPCPEPVPAKAICGLPGEIAYAPDKTNNFEVGLKTQWFDRKLTVNLAAYYIDWKDPHVASVTTNGLQSITVNGGGAQTTGFEIALAARPTSRLSIHASYAYTDPKLTAFSPALIDSRDSPTGFLDGEKGDRLPGSPKNTGNLGIDYAVPLSSSKTLTFGYNASGQSNVFTKTGDRGNAYLLHGFVRHDISATLAGETWSITAYCNNLFDKYSEVGTTRYSPDYFRAVSDAQGNPVYVRSFQTYVLPPRQFGLRARKTF